MLQIPVLRPLLLASLLLAVCIPAASASVVERRGSELVFEDDPGMATQLDLVIRDGALFPRFPTRIGPGCEVSTDGPRCPLAGVTAIRLLMGDADDDIDLTFREPSVPPLAIDLGEGNNNLRSFNAAGPGRLSAVDIRSGAGRDRIDLFVDAGQLGRVTVDSGGGADLVALAHPESADVVSGAGDDEVALRTIGPVTVATGAGDDFAVDVGGAPVTISGAAGDDTLGGQVGKTDEPSLVDGGSGDDTLRTTAVAGAPLRLAGGPGTDLIESRDRNAATVTCGSGRDYTWLSDADRPDSSCGPHLFGFDTIGGLRTCPADPWRTRVCKAAKPRPAVVGTYGPAPRALKLRIGRVRTAAVIAVKVTTVETRARPAVTLAQKRVKVRKGAVRLSAPLTAAGRRMLGARGAMSATLVYDLLGAGPVRDRENAGYRVRLSRRS